MVRGLSAVLAVLGAALAYFLIAPSLPALDHEEAAVLVAGACGMAAVGACGLVLAGAWDEPFVMLTLAIGAGMIGASLTDVDAPALENITKAVAATAFGLLLAFTLRSPAALLGVALLVLGIDLLSALSGPAESLVRGRSESVDALGLALPRWGSDGVVEVGVPGLVFLGFYLGSAWRFDFRRLLTAFALLAGLVGAVVFAVESDRPVPVLAGLSLAVLLPNLDRIPRALRSELHGSARRTRLAVMDLEEHTLETVSERCEECGAALTDEELALALESGGPALCSIHLAEVVPLEDDDQAEEPE